MFKRKKKINWASLLSKTLIIGIITALFKITFVRTVFGGWGAESSPINTTFLTTEILDAFFTVFLFELLILRSRRWAKEERN